MHDGPSTTASYHKVPQAQKQLPEEKHMLCVLYFAYIFNILCTRATIGLRACLSLQVHVCLTDRQSVQDPGLGNGVAAVVYGEAAVIQKITK